MTEEMPVADISDSVIMGSLDRSIHKGPPLVFKRTRSEGIIYYRDTLHCDYVLLSAL